SAGPLDWPRNITSPTSRATSATPPPPMAAYRMGDRAELSCGARPQPFGGRGSASGWAEAARSLTRNAGRAGGGAGLRIGAGPDGTDGEAAASRNRAPQAGHWTSFPRAASGTCPLRPHDVQTTRTGMAPPPRPGPDTWERCLDLDDTILSRR